ncbi:short-chain dehydrogenase/reductase [Aspergillus vadensis CBS 113365]|uniref:Short-chain dehydrogenase/reductase n=1 Tax=Aspergillus vadensis (strain CBS 113365 / IMI 142717 / IBT 24658) TaxID=1448311 RepID=A0A319B9S4_ASPVC|nr:short-chain dehydrogenase/reductase [Aspergillus vadensis CBS 113365]PYH63253.1 short-chain dehydrogenase/reductase [Aspergillus vadensis CBS 113365]
MSYSAVHATPKGPGDARPTALQIVQDNNMQDQLKGKVAVVTGVSSGLGVETVRALAATGAMLYLTARDLSKARTALGDIFQPDTMELVQMDQASLSSVRQAAQLILSKTNKVNILIGNAGVMAVPDLQLTEDGYEMQFATNHLAHFLLFNLLKPALLAGSTPEFHSRVVLVSSSGHRVHGINEADNYHFQKGGYEPWVAYGQSKTANIYTASEIERRYGGQGLHGLSLHPGIIATGLGRFLSEEQIQALLTDETVGRVAKSTEQGAATTLWAAVGREWEGKGGKYLADCAEAEDGEYDGHVGRSIVSYTYWPEGEERLWRDSLEMVILILEELNIPYKINSFGFEDVKKPPFININPNGRVPTIQDPNTPSPTKSNHPFTLWESGAIIQYLIDRYDPTHKLSFPPSSIPEKHLLNQYLQFQMSGQGPYYGQCGWFSTLSPDNLPTAITRYQREVHSILSVLNTILKGKSWLVGEKCTYADLAFLPWNYQLGMLIRSDDNHDILGLYPWVKAWQERMEVRESWKRTMVLREKLMREQGLGVNGMPVGVRDIGEYEVVMRRRKEEGERVDERVDEEEGVLGCVGIGGQSIRGCQEQGKKGEREEEDEGRWDEQTGVMGCIGVGSVGKYREKGAKQEAKEEEEDDRWDEDVGVPGCFGVGNPEVYRTQLSRAEGKKDERWDEETGVLGCTKISV